MKFVDVKNKVKSNLPVIITTVAALGSAAVSVYYSRKIIARVDGALPPSRRTDFSLYLSGREMDKIKSGIPRNCLDDLYIVTKDMLTGEAQERVPKVLFKD